MCEVRRASPAGSLCHYAIRTPYRYRRGRAPELIRSPRGLRGGLQPPHGAERERRGSGGAAVGSRRASSARDPRPSRARARAVRRGVSRPHDRPPPTPPPRPAPRPARASASLGHCPASAHPRVLGHGRASMACARVGLASLASVRLLGVACSALEACARFRLARFRPLGRSSLRARL